MNSKTQSQVGLTSRYMAAVRAIDHKRPDRLFSDPFAEKLEEEDIIAEIAPRSQEYEDRGRPVAAVRTRFFFDEPEKLFAEFGWQASVVQFGDETALAIF